MENKKRRLIDLTDRPGINDNFEDDNKINFANLA